MTSNRSAFTRFFLGAWRLIDGARKLALNLIFLIVLYIVVIALIDTDEAFTIQQNTALILQPYGDVVEQYSGTPLDFVLQQATQTERTETRLRDLVEAVRRASDDDKIVRLVIDPTYLRRIGLASLLELEAAIAEFKASGKPVIALADNLGQQQYFLASMADEIWLNPMGMVWIDGFSSYRQFYREGLEKLEVEVNLFRAGKFKSAMEPWIRDDMSPEAKEANLFWISSLWQQYLEAISRQRGVPLENLSEAINDFADRLESVNGDFAQFALNLGLVDQLINRPEANLALASLGAAGEGSEGLGLLLVAIAQAAAVRVSALAGRFARVGVTQDVAALEVLAVAGLLEDQVFGKALGVVAYVQACHEDVPGLGGRLDARPRHRDRDGLLWLGEPEDAELTQFVGR